MIENEVFTTKIFDEALYSCCISLALRHCGLGV